MLLCKDENKEDQLHVSCVLVFSTLFCPFLQLITFNGKSASCHVLFINRRGRRILKALAGSVLLTTIGLKQKLIVLTFRPCFHHHDFELKVREGNLVTLRSCVAFSYLCPFTHLKCI